MTDARCNEAVDLTPRGLQRQHSWTERLFLYFTVLARAMHGREPAMPRHCDGIHTEHDNCSCPPACDTGPRKGPAMPRMLALVCIAVWPRNLGRQGPRTIHLIIGAFLGTTGGTLR